MFHELNEVLATFDYHKPTDEQVERIAIVRKSCKSVAAVIWGNCPNGPDRTAAIRKLHEAMMTANKSIVLEGEVTG